MDKVASPLLASEACAVRPPPTLTLLLTAALLPACANLGYYARATRGQLDIMEKARPIADVLADPATPPDVKARLEAATRLREFATRELGLPGGKGFRTYADLGRPFVVWNVYAAPELSLAPRQWCFAFAGCVSYRGYFSETEARAFAANLAAAGDDVHVGGVAAYSTLGWFDDPVLNTFVRYPETELARLVFHELAHRVAYAADDTVFNESFATAVELEGARRWLAARGPERAVADFEASRRRAADFLALIGRTRARLSEVYASAASDGAKREAKALAFSDLRAEYASLRASWGGYAGYDRWFDADLNNAKLASVESYAALVPAFESLLERLGGDLPRLYAETRGLAALPKAHRLARLRGEPSPAQTVVGGEVGP
jgi:predicted aminopeptidase